jgi:hypothetical protein
MAKIIYIGKSKIIIGSKRTGSAVTLPGREKLFKNSMSLSDISTLPMVVFFFPWEGEMKRNYLLEDRIKAYVSEHPGLMRRQIARGLQKSGIHLGQQHISNRAGELIALRELKETVTEDGKRLIFPAVSEEVSP